jgi:hypothetical protein
MLSQRKQKEQIREEIKEFGIAGHEEDNHGNESANASVCNATAVMKKVFSPELEEGRNVGTIEKGTAVSEEQYSSMLGEFDDKDGYDEKHNLLVDFPDYDEFTPQRPALKKPSQMMILQV